MMNPRLYKAARLGDTDELQALLEDDPLILERGSLGNVPETCLHIAALAGRVNFVKKIMRIKPEFATKLNKDGYAPIHMASANGYEEILRELLATNKELGRQKSADGRTALHFASVTGSVAVLRELATSCPECKVDLTELQESALHLALKNNQVKAFKLLLGIMKETNTEEMKMVVNVQDHDGNTILHVSTAKRQLQAVKLLLDQQGHENMVKVEVNRTNKDGFSALDILLDSRRNGNEAVDKEIREMLQQAGAVRSSHCNMISNATPTSTLQIDHNHLNLVAQYPATRLPQPQSLLTLLFWLSPRRFLNFWLIELSSLLTGFKFWTSLIQEIENSTPDTRNALMVVAVLIATVTYQSVLSPVGGFKQISGDKDLQNSNGIAISGDQALEHSNGIAVLGSDAQMFFFIAFFSSTGFSLSVLIILMLTSQFPLKVLLRLAVLSMSANFVCTLLYISTVDFGTIYIITMVLFALVLLHMLYFITWMSRRFWTSRRRQPNN